MKKKIELGKYQELIVKKETDFGVYLKKPAGTDSEKIILPKAQEHEGPQI